MLTTDSVQAYHEAAHVALLNEGQNTDRLSTTLGCILNPLTAGVAYIRVFIFY